MHWKLLSSHKLWVGKRTADIDLWARPCSVCGKDFIVPFAFASARAMDPEARKAKYHNPFGVVTCPEHRGQAQPSKPAAPRKPKAPKPKLAKANKPRRTPGPKRLPDSKLTPGSLRARRSRDRRRMLAEVF
jgi:hypothetical protein